MFFKSQSIEELAAAQGVKPMTDVKALAGTWPGSKDDGFEAGIDELRHAERKREIIYRVLVFTSVSKLKGASNG